MPMRAGSSTVSSITSPVSRASVHVRMRMTAVRLLALGAFVATIGVVRTAKAQVAADETWRTIRTAHFAVHFTPRLEDEARHAAAVAERAYANLATELVRPRGTIDLVVSDATDISNGSATVLPRPTVIIYARPPVEDPSLESYDDWTALVLQHELTHIFQLDRTRGWWSAAQHVFGRNPVLFPELYTPAWLTEGLAVYYESRYTSGGRLEGTYHSAVARAAALDRALPRLDQVSLATSRFPYGESAYVYGSFIWEELARAHGAGSIPDFIERQSAAPIPFLLDRDAKQTFGETFTRAWQHWRDSVLRTIPDSAERMRDAAVPLPLSRGTMIPHGGRSIAQPRWRTPSELLYVANTGREMPGLYAARVPVSGAPTPGVRLDRRNTLDVNAPRSDGSVVFAQSDFTDRFHSRSDLYVARNGGVRQITHGARLSAPDVRGDGMIVAVQTLPATTRIVRVAADGRAFVPLTPASLGAQWTQPRWSPDGAHVVAVRTALGVSEIIILDTLGNATAVARNAAVLRSPVWTPDQRMILYSSDASGISQLYGVEVGRAGYPGPVVQLTRDPAGVYGVDVVASAGDSMRIAATVLRADGFHLLTWTTSRAALQPERGGRSALALATPRDTMWSTLRDDTARARRYSPWRTLVPAYWSPTFAQEAHTGAIVGALTSGEDAIGRHAYVAQVGVNTKNGKVDASFDYRYNRLREPVLDLSLEQGWNYGSIYSETARIGTLERRDRLASLHATFARPRVRTYTAITIGAELQQRAYETDPARYLAQLDPFYSATHTYPTLVLGASFSDAQRPTLSVSPEDGVSLAAAVRQRWEASSGAAGRNAVAVGNLYKSLDLPGFAHHVIAIRGAVGAADRRSPSVFDVGGVSGSSLEIVPGIDVGSSARTFPARGFEAGIEEGIVASSGSVEYRAPLAMPSRGLGLIPLFVDRASLAVFADAARAACPGAATPACSPLGIDGPTLASVGAEFNIDTALQFDVPYRFRFGIAHPIHGARYASAPTLTTYVTLGASF